MINVTKTFFPPIGEYIAQIQRVWDNQWLTNRGELVLELEKSLKEYLCVSNILIMCNGTIPLQVALKNCGKGGEIITTPFSYVATTAAIVWENCIPKFVDIHPEYLTIDESKIEDAITERTTAILATHVFGNPCHIEAIEAIARKYNIYVIYDAAHCFGIKYRDRSIFSYGDISTCSFHATKLFHTGEGGALFTNDPKLIHDCFASHNFGHNGSLDFHGLGINGKISELQTAMGLAVLPYMEDILNRRRSIVSVYDAVLDFSKMKRLRIRQNTEWNYSYYPIIFETEQELLGIIDELNENQIFPRRYFYPSLNSLPYVNNTSMPISENIASRILCLPLYHSLEISDAYKIAHLINTKLLC